MSRATFLLPPAARFGAQRLSVAGAAALGRANTDATGESGRHAQLRRHVAVPAGTWPVAAMLRQLDAGDAGDAIWLRIEPAYLRPDINGVRLMAYGDALGVGQADTAALLPSLKPLFGDAGFTLDAPVPARWYARLAPGTGLPAFADPDDALGEDLFEHMDTAFDGASPQARRWRALLNEAQVVLHNHDWNARRVADGKLPINALWPWGGGVLPDGRLEARCAHALVYSDDTVARALAAGAARVEALPPRYRDGAGDRLFDLDAMRDLARFEHDWLQPALQALGRGGIAMLALDGGDGTRFEFTRWQRLRFWRRKARGRLGANAVPDMPDAT